MGSAPRIGTQRGLATSPTWRGRVEIREAQPVRDPPGVAPREGPEPSFESHDERET